MNLGVWKVGEVKKTTVLVVVEDEEGSVSQTVYGLGGAEVKLERDTLWVAWNELEFGL